MRTEFSQRHAERVILEFGRRLRRRLKLQPKTPSENIILAGLAAGDPVARVFAEDPNLRRIFAGFWRVSLRDRADAETIDAIKALSIADAIAERDAALARLSPVERKRRERIEALVSEARATKSEATTKP